MVPSGLVLAICLQLDGVTAEVKGYEADRLSACVERHVAATEASYLTAPFRFRSESRMWQTEFWGKWMHAAAPLVRMTGCPRLRQSVDLPMGTHDENPENALPRPVGFCDYASAGNTWDGTSFGRVWLPVVLPPQSLNRKGKILYNVYNLGGKPQKM